MSQSLDRILVGNAERTSRALDGARSMTRQDSRPSSLRLAVIVDGADGVYTVGLVGADGSVVDSIPGVRPWGAGTFAVADKVMVCWIGDRPVPWILAGGSGGLTGVDSSAAGPVVPWADVLGLAKDAAARDVDVELVVDSCHSGELTRSLRESFGSDRAKASTGGVRAQGIAKLADHIEALERFVTPGTFEEHKAALAERLGRELLPALHFYGCGTPETSAAILGSHAVYRSWSIRTMLALDASLATTLAGPER